MFSRGERRSVAHRGNFAPKILQYPFNSSLWFSDLVGFGRRKEWARELVRVACDQDTHACEWATWRRSVDDRRNRSHGVCFAQAQVVTVIEVTLRRYAIEIVARN